MNRQAVTVSQLNRYVKAKLSLDPKLSGLTVKGELSNFKCHSKSSHFYFTLKDEACSIRAVMFRQSAMRVRFTPEDGMNVIVTGSVQVYERDGVYQLYCETMQPDGIGELYLAFEQRKEKLQKEGLFDPAHKRPLPRYPQKIGVVTSKTGAAFQDILNILKRRYPIATVVLFPALVQGEEAPASITAGIRAAGKYPGIDVLIVGRGGGSMEDLWAFNDEAVARAAYDSPVPVVSAVGHEIDFTILDFVADLRAPTPSAAAELCTPDRQNLLLKLEGEKERLDKLLAAQVLGCETKLSGLAARLAALSPEEKIKRENEVLVSLRTRLGLGIGNSLRRKEEQLAKAASALEAMSPLAVLTRGYSITRDEHEDIVRSVGELLPGALIETILPDGSFLSVIQQIKRKAETK